MSDFFIMLLSMVLLGVLISLKINIGFSIFVAAIFLAILKNIGFVPMLVTFGETLISSETLNMFGVVFLVNLFVSVLRSSGFLDEIVSSFQKVFSPRLFVPMFAFIIGALPMPGGALVSAPLVEEGSKTSEISCEEKAVVNYWFRHIWEPISPVYMEIPLMATIVGVEIPFLVSLQWPLTLGMIISGMLFLVPRIKVKDDFKVQQGLKLYLDALKSISPILLVMVLAVVFGINVLISLLFGIALIFAIKRLNILKVFKAFDLKDLFKMLFLMYAIFLLKGIAINTNLIKGVYTTLIASNITPFLILFFLPFVVGVMTGMSAATFGISYPLLLPLIKPVTINPLNLFVAYLGGWTGIMLTPTHLCLSLSIDYFKAKTSRTFQLLLKNVGLVLFVAFLWTLVLGFAK